ncbi:FtsX-like permease family protein [Aggregicoccus sp. 17bor-14]|uniref:FtsX-like permease family protein n=1 Tax=Myxococcaceae TaxID=31 RepID=UPI00129C1AA8|nr:MULTISPECIES: ABC transporter permease [Myxococcaceae]MBF5041695.1 ABC transporter permease [Simulacricoccus sp. 17bor-14]MRI87477.1 FtsX-like permease family protein [Aggregicoccus sp. 17bor-14]
MRGLLVRSSLRHLGAHPWLTALSLLGIALGVAVVVSIDLANTSATRAFERSTETLTGAATHQVVGGSSGVAESVFTELKLGRTSLSQGEREDTVAAAPVVEGYVRARADGRTLTVLGVDPFSEGAFRPYVRGDSPGDLSALLTEPGTALLAASTARELGVKAGDTLSVAAEGVPHSVRIVGLVGAADAGSGSALDGLLMMDLSSAQELLRRVGRLSRIDLILTPGAEGTVRASLPPGVELVPAGARAGTVAQMTRAFRTNLTALSLLALVVGMFLIYNTMTFSVVQRRGLLGRLRALGVTRRELFALVLGEAAVLGAVGTVGGLLAGILLGRGLVGLVTRTINDLYFVVSVRGLTLEPLTLAKGLLLGLGATVLAALFPAWEAAHAAPVVTMRASTVEESARRRAPLLALGGVGVLALGTALLLLPTHALLPAYAGLFAVLLGAALLVPWVTAHLASALVRPLGAAFGAVGRLAARGVTASLSRTAVALAALAVAVATTVGVGLMVSSFRGTVVAWLEASLQADVYISPPGYVFRRGETTFAPGLVERLRQTPGVKDSSTVRAVSTRVNGRDAELIAVDLGRTEVRPYRFKEGEASEVWQALRAPDAVLVSEPFGFHRNVHRGDVLQVSTDRGVRPLRVVGVYYDYGSDVGALLMRRDVYDRLFDDRGVSGLALIAQPGVSPETLVQRVRERAGGAQALNVRANATLRRASLDIFDRTFTITQVLRLLAVGVAFVGVLSALMALQLERARELAVLRATGLTPRQLWGMVSLQTGMLGLFAGLFAVPLGVALALILVHAINQRSFGWTLQLALSSSVLVQAVVLALAAAALAGLYPAWKMARANPALALREE